MYKELLSFNNKQTTQLNYGQRTCIDISPKKVYKWPMSSRKDAQHH